MGLGGAIALCGVTGMIWDAVAPNARLPAGGGLSTITAAAVTVAVGIGVFAWGRGEEHTLTRREALLAVGLIWIAAGVCGGLPYWFGAGMSPADAFFESVSGLTTTGATVITDIETRLSRPILLWRSMSQWLGGMGIVVLFVAVFPSLGAGSKRLYRGEAPGAQAEGFRPRMSETSITLWKIYAAFTILEIVILSGLGMDVFEALCHGMTTMSTGGFSTRDASVGGFGVPAYEWTISVFMLLASVNFGLYYLLLRGRSLRSIVRDVELRAYAVIVVGATLLLALLNYRLHPEPIESLRYALFMTATTVSSTGYGTDDYTQFPVPAFGIMLAIMFIGGCSGSTAGGIKIERIVILAKQTLAQIKQSFEPTAVHVVRLGKSVVPVPVLGDVASFFVVYMVTIGLGVLLVASVEAVPITTAFGAMLTSVSNMGPAPFFHHVEGASDNFASYGGPTKVFFAWAMLLGRLEFFTLLSLFLPGFWRR